MRTKWFKRNNNWEKVTLSDEEESKLKEKSIEDYIYAFNNIQKKVESQKLTEEQKFSLSLEIFKKLESPGHYIMERILEEKRDEEMTK